MSLVFLIAGTDVNVYAPLWYHPTTLLVVDDDADFFQRLAEEVSPFFAPFLEPNPENALAYLNRWSYCRKSALSLEPSGEAIAQPAIDRQRDRTVVVVVGHHLCPMGGLVFCEQIRSARLPVKRLLLAGATTTGEVVDAVKAGVIDAYAGEHTSREAIAQIHRQLDRLAWDQFCELSALLPTDAADVADGAHADTASITDFYQAFKAVREAESIVQFHRLNLQGDFAVTDKHGTVRLLSFYDEADFKATQRIANQLASHSWVVNALAQRRQYPARIPRGAFARVDTEALAEAMVPVNCVSNGRLFYRLAYEPSREGNNRESEIASPELGVCWEV